MTISPCTHTLQSTLYILTGATELSKGFGVYRVCPYMLRALSYAVRKLNSVPEYGKWLGLRFSYGMNGILVHNEDLISLTAYLRCTLSQALLFVSRFQ